MSKELIVSVNGREKKIAIVENERVTEFYIERGEENQGIVGNIYKGRVMRVLPGMQSAFVDIGLERDAFLYVSDFFDEEEEFERIVMDKSKKTDATEAARAAQEQIEQARVEREHRIEATHERAEPLIDAEPAVIEAAPLEAPEIIEAEPQPSVAEQPREQEGGVRKRGRRGRRRGRGGEEHAPEVSAGREAELTPALAEEEITTPFVADAGSFERVVDEDEVVAAANGEMFKDARLQERIFDQIHAVEFDIEDVPTTEVGTLLNSERAVESSFQRIDDSDIAPAGEEREAALVQETVAAHVGAFIDEIKEETVGAQTFERVSDDEGAVEEEAEAKGKRGKRTATKRASKKATTEKASKTKRAGSKASTKSATKKSSKKAAGKKGSTRRKAAAGTDEGETDIAVLESEAARAENTDLVAAEAADGEHFEVGPDDEDYEDAEASLSSGRTRAEFATRRGGRRRRRPNKQQQEANGEDRSNGKDEDIEVAEVEEVKTKRTAPPPRAPSRQDRNPRPDRGGRDERAGGNGGRSSSSSSSSGGGREPRGGGSRSPRHQPTITDLLREGQEVLVQIAKEPIAKKGARITSHIALPGRFLVYMPTVEHVGVSRKIESDSERARLRKLIQVIRAEEDVPSGGFIVRTAGIGISEEDLRDDARYLVRTWLDIRRSAEKTKAPALVHRDLDLVQRLLRDQLSDDFAAIRVDSEEEYLRIVEFINRIQPRMVKRVKLYTRETPILEAYNVQSEIDKAIKPRVWLKSGGYLVINQTEALVAIDVNTGKFVGRGGTRLEDTIT
ncbi:MAG TPA: ribonuclease E/G, partial [Pyrinomonadaceae bacterium]|nr:ribonuclease E/G [Pyrinomonadaceae bacterium]